MTINDDLFGTGKKQIMDPVHGGFRIYDHELAVIDQPLFQRLRFIKQNDVATLVFPGALHTRFQHSLGVMHIAGRVYRSVITNHLAWTASTRNQPISAEVAESIRYFYYCFRLAGLLHDTGHFPFSHEFESSEIAKELLSSNEIKEFVGGAANTTKHVSHEDYSLLCASKLLLGACDSLSGFPVEPDDVLTLMENSSRVPSDKFRSHAVRLVEVLLRNPGVNPSILSERATETIKTFLSNLISGELDVDKMDYLLRDSHFTGVSYGVYNIDHLISTLRIGISLQPWWVGVAILDKGLGALEDFVFSRFQLYTNVWSHKGVAAGKFLLGKAIDELLQNDNIKTEVKQNLIDIHKFSYFTEDYFWEAFRKKASEDPKSVAAKLLQRKLPKHLGTLDKSPSDFSIEQELNNLKRNHPGAHSYKTHIKFSKIRNRSYDEMKLLRRQRPNDSDDYIHSLAEIKDSTDFFQKFEDTGRVYFFTI